MKGIANSVGDSRSENANSNNNTTNATANAPTNTMSSLASDDGVKSRARMNSDSFDAVMAPNGANSIASHNLITSYSLHKVTKNMSVDVDNICAAALRVINREESLRTPQFLLCIENVRNAMLKHKTLMQEASDIVQETC